eukprot:TRINITY_DN12071_c0_g1_i1.p3 TRINITY_DN12071_c0_g1~~TRINITY_DN12071_c0_g1_i1.p3  ORF type:complete len:154 (-),score=27.89 TRINITY_DN12071_c0_g1_i1:154-615(-)
MSGASAPRPLRPTPGPIAVGALHYAAQRPAAPAAREVRTLSLIELPVIPASVTYTVPPHTDRLYLQAPLAPHTHIVLPPLTSPNASHTLEVVNPPGQHYSPFPESFGPISSLGLPAPFHSVPHAPILSVCRKAVGLPHHPSTTPVLAALCHPS